MQASEEPVMPRPEATPPTQQPRWEAPTLEAYELACEVTAYAGRKRFPEEDGE
jgi:hypothetical protein